MALVVNTNIEALNAQRNLNINNNKLGKSIQRLSSGLRINSAADDAAGLSIATKFQAQVRGSNQAVRNANNAISLVQVAEGGIDTITNILQRLRELAVQAASDDNTNVDRNTLTKEADNLVTELTRVSNTSEFNTQTLLDGSFKNSLIQIGANADQTLSINFGDLRGSAIGARAEFIADIGDGVTTAVEEGFGAGEIKINGTDVAATNSADDQFSVLDISSSQLGSAVSTITFNFFVNGTSITVSMVVNQAGSEIAASIVNAVTAAGINNVTARVVNGSGYVIEATKGETLLLAVSNTGAATASVNIISNVGLTNLASNFAIGSTDAAIANSNGESSAIAKAVAINAVKSNSTVQAKAIEHTVTGNTSVSAAVLTSGDVFINGIDIGTVKITDNDGTGALVTAINSKVGESGVTATIDGSGKLVLTAVDGRNIAVTTKDASTATTTLGLDASDMTGTSFVFRGQVRLNSSETFLLTSASSLEDLDPTLGASKSVAKDLSTFNINSLKIDSQKSATAAILTLDAALDDVNTLRSDIGAIQNRIEFAIQNLEIAAENTSASESRIRDADFAKEVAILTKNQILVQAGASMLAQANGLPQIALQLLQG